MSGIHEVLGELELPNLANLARVGEEIKGLVDRVCELKESNEELASQLQVRSGQVERLQESVSQAQQEIGLLKEEGRRLEECRAERDSRVSELESNVIELEALLKISEEEADEAREELARVRKVFSDLATGKEILTSEAAGVMLQSRAAASGSNGKGKVLLPERSEGYGMPFVYHSLFMDEFKKRDDREKDALVKALSQLHPTERCNSLGTRSIRHAPYPFGIPTGSLISRAGGGSKWRFAWRREVDGIHIFFLKHHKDVWGVEV
jgi:predicted RNase H-like nuclease (RuvC/YqgF family)